MNDINIGDKVKASDNTIGKVVKIDKHGEIYLYTDYSDKIYGPYPVDQITRHDG